MAARGWGSASGEKERVLRQRQCHHAKAYSSKKVKDFQSMEEFRPTLSAGNSQEKTYSARQMSLSRTLVACNNYRTALGSGTDQTFDRHVTLRSRVASSRASVYLNDDVPDIPRLVMCHRRREAAQCGHYKRCEQRTHNLLSNATHSSRCERTRSHGKPPNVFI